VDKAIGDIRVDYPLTSVDDETAVRPESNFGTDILHPFQVVTDPQEEGTENVSQKQKEEQLEKHLWQIRRQREEDPEFKRLVATSGTFEPRR
jgi:hypothetical protein